MRATSRLESLYLDMLETLVRRCKADVAPVVIALGDMHRASPSALEAIAYMREKLRELDTPVLFREPRPTIPMHQVERFGGGSLMRFEWNCSR